MTMKAAVLEEYNKLIVKEVEVPLPGPDEVLIRVRSVGICGSDVHGYDGTSGRRIPPVIMGHEAAGEIQAVGSSVTQWAVGQRVTFDSTIYQMDDWYSRRGWYNLSDGRRVLGVSCDEYRQDGAFAEYVVVPEHVLYRIPDSLSFDHAALSEPLAVALHGVTLTSVEIGDTVAVVGAGVIGLLVIAAVALRGCRSIIVSDVADSRLNVAAKLGATHMVNPNRGQDLSEICAECTNGRGADAVIEAVGLEQTIQAGVAAVRRGGTVTILGNISPKVALPMQRIVSGQLRVQGSCAICDEFPAAITLLSKGHVPARQLISASVPLEDAPSMFDKLHARDPELLKVILHP